MKNLALTLLTALFTTFALQAQNADEQKDPKNDFSYALGMLIGSNRSGQGVTTDDINLEEFKKAFEAALAKKETKMDQNTANGIVQQRMTLLQQMAGQKQAEGGKKFLEENGKRPEVKTTASGLQYEVITEGNGAKPTLQDKVKVHYHGTLIDGKVFDSSVQRGEPISFGLGQVIPGWQEGVQLMGIGSKYRFYIPYNLAYGERGTSGIPGYSTLIFEVELLGINE